MSRKLKNVQKYLNKIISKEWLNANKENKEIELLKYGQIFIYKNKIIPIKYLTKEVIDWFQDCYE